MTLNLKAMRFFVSPGALEAMQESNQEPKEFLDRHFSCDWGDVSEEDALLNDEALKDGSRIMSAYETANKTRLWVITEATNDDGERETTVILLPEEY